MLDHFSVNQEVERGRQGLADTDKRVDANDLGVVLPSVNGALEPGHSGHANVGSAFELVLTPASSFPQHLHPMSNAAGDLSVGFGGVPVRPPRSLFALLRSHSDQLRHCETSAQEGRVFSP